MLSKRNHRYVTFWNWGFFLLSLIFWRFAQLAVCQGCSFLSPVSFEWPICIRGSARSLAPWYRSRSSPSTPSSPTQPGCTGRGFRLMGGGRGRCQHLTCVFPGAGELGLLLGPQRPGSGWAAGSQELSWHECAAPGQGLGDPGAWGAAFGSFPCFYGLPSPPTSL